MSPSSGISSLSRTGFFLLVLFSHLKIHDYILFRDFRQTSDRLATPTDDGHLDFTVTLRIAKTICIK